jgi:hypothetical protein
MLLHHSTFVGLLINYLTYGSLNFFQEIFHCSQDPWEIIWKVYDWILSFSFYKPLGLQPLVPMKLGTSLYWVNVAWKPKILGYVGEEVM